MDKVVENPKQMIGSNEVRVVLSFSLVVVISFQGDVTRR